MLVSPLACTPSTRERFFSESNRFRRCRARNFVDGAREIYVRVQPIGTGGTLRTDSDGVNGAGLFTLESGRTIAIGPSWSG